MKRLILIVAVILVLAGGGVGGWWFFLRPPPDSPDGEPAAEASGDAAEGDIFTKTSIDFDPIVLPILRQGQVRQHVTFVLTLQLDHPIAIERIRDLKPRLRDALISELHGIYAFRHVQQGDAAMPIIRHRVALAGERVLGRGTVKAVLFRSMDRRDLPTG